MNGVKVGKRKIVRIYCQALTFSRKPNFFFLRYFAEYDTEMDQNEKYTCFVAFAFPLPASLLKLPIKSLRTRSTGDMSLQELFTDFTNFNKVKS